MAVILAFNASWGVVEVEGDKVRVLGPSWCNIVGNGVVLVKQFW